MNSTHRTPVVSPAPDPVDPTLTPLLDEPFASALSVGSDRGGIDSASRRRLLARVATSREAARGLFTARRRRLATDELAPGVLAQRLYAATDAHAPRPGEPALARLIELRPGSRWSGPDAYHHREWLVLQGTVTLGALRLGPRDFHAIPAGHPNAPLHSDEGALVFLREAAPTMTAPSQESTVLDATAGWPDFAPGIQRRVLWHREGLAAMLYYAQPGASVPRHTHGHDEECLMVQGELFLDDVLLQPGDYQLAPAGTGHQITQTDTGVVIYAHGDLDLRFVV